MKIFNELSIKFFNNKNMLKLLLEYIHFLKTRKKYWLLPIAILLILVGGILVVGQGSAVAPFIYAIF